MFSRFSIVIAQALFFRLASSVGALDSDWYRMIVPDAPHPPHARAKDVLEEKKAPSASSDVSHRMIAPHAPHPRAKDVLEEKKPLSATQLASSFKAPPGPRGPSSDGSHRTIAAHAPHHARQEVLEDKNALSAMQLASSYKASEVHQNAGIGDGDLAKAKNALDERIARATQLGVKLPAGLRCEGSDGVIKLTFPMGGQSEQAWRESFMVARMNEFNKALESDPAASKISHEGFNKAMHNEFKNKNPVCFETLPQGFTKARELMLMPGFLKALRTDFEKQGGVPDWNIDIDLSQAKNKFDFREYVSACTYFYLLEQAVFSKTKKYMQEVCTVDPVGQTVQANNQE